MASFADQIPQFNPYIQQLPVEAMVKVGMEKQKRYDEGVQKIQTSIDNVAGLDIVRGVDQKYLQSKLNALGNNLKTVAAGDFSNYQLVNSVGGMATQIGKDKNIQNAVSSTAKYRKELANREAYRKEGKDSPSNDYIFNRGADKWLNSDDINSSFNTTYDPYTNWKKNSLEIIKALTGDKTITEDAFTTDANGNVVIADAIVQKKMGGISPEQIQQALLVGLSPADFKQMQNDSLYNYSNQDGNQFKETIKGSYANKINTFAEQRTFFENSKSSTTSNEQKKILDNKIRLLDNTINSLTKEQDDLFKSIDEGNVDGAKAQYGTYNSINGLSKAFSHVDVSETYVASPFVAAQQFRETKAQQWKQFIMGWEQDERFHKDDQYWKSRDDQRAEEKVKAETGGYGGLPTTVNQEDLPIVTLNKVVSDIAQGHNDLHTIEYNFLKQQGKDQKWLDQQHDAWEKNPNGVDAIVSNYFDSYSNKQREVRANERMVTQINADATAKFGSIDKYIPKGSPNVVLTNNRTGKQDVYTAKDFVDFNSRIREYVSVSDTSGDPLIMGSKLAGQTIWNDAKAKAELSPKMYRLYEIEKNGAKSSADNVLKANLKNYHEKVNTPYVKVIKQINDYTADELTSRLTSSQAVEYNIPAATPAQKNSLASLLTAYANRAEMQKGGLAKSPNFDVPTARKLAAEDRLVFNIRVSEGTELQPASYQVTTTGESGVVKFNVTPEEKRAVFGNQYDASPAVQMIRPYQEQMRKMAPKGKQPYTTAWNNQTETTQKNGFLNKTDFPSIRAYGVKANLIQPVKGQYQLRFAAYDPITKEWNNDIVFPKSSTLIPEEGVAGAMMNMSDAAMFELINGRVATANELKQLQSAIKKP